MMVVHKRVSSFQLVSFLVRLFSMMRVFATTTHILHPVVVSSYQANYFAGGLLISAAAVEMWSSSEVKLSSSRIHDTRSRACS